MMETRAAEANAQLAALRKVPHNGRMYQSDDSDYLLALAEVAGGGLGAINPQWFRDQAKLVRGTLSELAALREQNAKLREALEFYANRDNYWSGPTGSSSDRDTMMEIDRGKRAAAALAAAQQPDGGRE